MLPQLDLINTELYHLYLISFYILDAIGGQIEVLDNLMVDLEEVCELLDLERRKAAQERKLSMLRHNREWVVSSSFSQKWILYSSTSCLHSVEWKSWE